MTCHGNSPESPCCWVNGTLCEFVTDIPGRVAGCGLRAELGTWTAVHSDPRYLANVRPVWVRLGIPDCGDWIGPGCCYGPEWTPENKQAYRLASEREGTPVEIRKQFA